jgi:hypothetical protein
MSVLAAEEPDERPTHSEAKRALRFRSNLETNTEIPKLKCIKA